MKIQKQLNGLEGHVVLVEENDLDRPLKLPEVQGEWVDIIRRCEGVVRKDGLFHFFYLTNNSFAIELLIPPSYSGPFARFQCQIEVSTTLTLPAPVHPFSPVLFRSSTKAKRS